jgi:multisubunit Na+/H+ antiporter MnhB subunit
LLLWLLLLFWKSKLNVVVDRNASMNKKRGLFNVILIQSVIFIVVVVVVVVVFRHDSIADRWWSRTRASLSCSVRVFVLWLLLLLLFCLMRIMFV